MGHTLSTTFDRGFAETLEATRSRLADAGRGGVLTEIDLAATLKARIGAEVAADARERLSAALEALSTEAVSR